VTEATDNVVNLPGAVCMPRRFMAAVQSAEMDGHEFKKARLALGLGRREASRLLRVSVSTLARWERGHPPVSRSAQILMRLMLWEDADRRP